MKYLNCLMLCLVKNYELFKIHMFAFSVVLILVVVIKIILCINTKIKKLEEELHENRTVMMISQITPHFIYNSLATISALCNEPVTVKAIEDFSFFLRGNMESLTNKKPISITQEIEFTES